MLIVAIFSDLVPLFASLNFSITLAFFRHWVAEFSSTIAIFHRLYFSATLAIFWRQVAEFTLNWHWSCKMDCGYWIIRAWGDNTNVTPGRHIRP